MDNRTPRDACTDKRGSLAFSSEYGRDGVAAALADDHNHVTFLTDNTGLAKLLRAARVRSAKLTEALQKAEATSRETGGYAISVQA